MTDLRKAAAEEQAVHPVVHLWDCICNWAEIIANDGKDANLTPPDWLVDAVKAATAPQKQPEQEPVAWQDPQYKTLIEPHKAHPDWIPLYTAPPSIEAAVLAEREACAKYLDGWNTAITDKLAAAIRARGLK